MVKTNHYQIALLDWQIQQWLKPHGNKRNPRLVKYAAQLNEIANERLS